MALILIPVALTKNLAAMAGLSVAIPALLVYLSTRTTHGWDKRRLLAAWAAVALLALAAVGQYAREDEVSRIIKKESIDERKTQNLVAYMMFKEAPLAGKGPGFFYRHFVEYRRAVWFENPPLRMPSRAANQAHNDYIQMLAEGGLLATTPLLSILAVWLFSQARYMVGTPGKTGYAQDAAIIGGAGGFWILAINALGNFPFHAATLAVTALFWAATCAKMIKYSANE